MGLSEDSTVSPWGTPPDPPQSLGVTWGPWRSNDTQSRPPPGHLPEENGRSRIVTTSLSSLLLLSGFIVESSTLSTKPPYPDSRRSWTRKTIVWGLDLFSR